MANLALISLSRCLPIFCLTRRSSCAEGRKGSGRRSALVNQVECRGGSTTERARGVRGKDGGSHLIDLALFLGILPGLTPEETPEAEAQHAGLHTRASWSGERPSQNCQRTRRRISFYFHTTCHTVTKIISLTANVFTNVWFAVTIVARRCPSFCRVFARIKTRTPIAPSCLFGTRDSRSFRVKL